MHLNKLKGKTIKQKTKELRREGLSRGEVEKNAKKWMKTQAALHNPDQVAGGNHLKIGGMAEGIVKMHLVNLLIQTI